MAASRNPQGNPETLLKAAQAKKEEATERLKKAIKKVVDSGETITFRAVAETAGLSVSYLYKYPEIKNKIAALRNQQQVEMGGIVNNVPPLQPASDKSKAVLLSKLREENRRLRAENEGLRKHIEVIQGRAVELRHVEVENNRLKRQLENVMQELEEYRHPSIKTTILENQNIASLDKKRSQRSDISNQIKSKLAELKIDLNTTLTKLIKSASEDLVLNAIAALKEGMASGEIQRPGGWLNKAIKDGWKPNEKHLPHNQAERDIFKQWFDLAYKQKLVLASTKGDDGQMYIYTREGVAIPFEKMLTEHPLEVLRES